MSPNARVKSSDWANPSAQPTYFGIASPIHSNSKLDPRMVASQGQNVMLKCREEVGDGGN